MENIWNSIAALLEVIANLGAGAVSMGVAYEPEVPAELQR